MLYIKRKVGNKILELPVREFDQEHEKPPHPQAEYQLPQHQVHHAVKNACLACLIGKSGTRYRIIQV